MLNLQIISEALWTTNNKLDAKSNAVRCGLMASNKVWGRET